MRQRRLFNVTIALGGAIALLWVFILVFQVGPVASQGSDEGEPTLVEDGAGVQQANFGESGGSYPLFISPDTTSLPAHQIDVVTSGYITAFIGWDGWGAAYDPGSNQVYHNDGSSLYVWPVGGTPALLGTITDAAGASLTVHGLAFYNGLLYATSISTDEIYTIDLGTLVATSVIALVNTSSSISGLAIDPTNGDIYGTDDIGNNALVRINNDGTVTVIAAYPGGETDVDGLAISSSRQAYLITDDTTPPYFNVYDLNTMTYTGVISNPWPTGAVQVAGAWIEQPFVMPSITLTKTVGLDPNSCATTDTIDVPAGGGGTQVAYCYLVSNTGPYTLSWHTLVDDQLGTILNNFPFPLGPGAGAFLTVSANITQTTVNSATWWADDGKYVASASDTATVNRLPPTGVSLSVFGGEGPQALTPLWLGLLLLLLAGTALLLRRRPAS